MLSNTKKPKKPASRCKWFVGLYFLSLFVVGGAMFLAHFISAWLI